MTPAFTTETALCADFAAAATAQGWTVYPETSGWDLLLVKDGTQLGVQAKLKANIKVLAQASQPLQWGRVGPDFLAVLVPEADRDFSALAWALGIMVLAQQRDRTYDSRSGEEHLLRHPEKRKLRWWPDLDEKCRHAPSHAFDAPCWLPPMVPTVAAGVPCPVSLTRWKVRALRLLARLEVRGYVTAADMRDCELAPSTWYSRYLEPTGGARGCWKRRDGEAQFDAQHPAEFAVFIEEERRRVVLVTPPNPRRLPLMDQS